jgi:hypothetical protein
MTTVAAWPLAWSWRRGTRRARFLAVALEHFNETGKWPTLRVVQKRLTQYVDLSSAKRTARCLPPALGRVEPDGRVILTVRGIRLADPNHPVLGDFERALVWASRSYRHGAAQVETVISRHELIAGLGLSEACAQRVMSLFASESLGSLGPEAELTLTSAIVPYLYARNVDEYLKSRRRRAIRKGVGQIARSPLALVRWFGSEEKTLFQKIVVGVLTAALAAGVIWAISGLATQQQPKGADHSPRKSAAARSGG